MKYIPSNITPEIYFYYFCEDENAKRFFEEYVEKTSNNVTFEKEKKYHG